ncbi:hypothetical protein [Terribacillus saccharophilus]|uniref:hypothetical protein n=1 Tax=Terribacillus saccharophilus TaxID=361277 RepID=UPI003981B63E
MNNNNDSKSSSTNEANKFPEVTAFQDEFTREFLESTEPTKEGYYAFLSKTGAYRMDFPEDMKINDKSYSIDPGKSSEVVIFSSQNSNGPFIDHRVEYYSFISDPQHGRDQIEGRVGVEINFEEVSTNYDQKLEIAEYKYENSSGIVSLITKDGVEGQIQIFSSLRCSKDMEENVCKEQIENKKAEIKKWLNSIQLISR